MPDVAHDAAPMMHASGNCAVGFLRRHISRSLAHLCARARTHGSPVVPTDGRRSWWFHVSVGISYIKGHTPYDPGSVATIPLWWCAALALAWFLSFVSSWIKSMKGFSEGSLVGFGIQVRRAKPSMRSAAFA